LGDYRVYNLPPGGYYVAASDARVQLGLLGANKPPRGLYLETGGIEVASGDDPLLYYPGVAKPSEAQKIRVSAGQERRIDLSLRPVKMVTVSGRVVDANGNRAAQVDVHLKSKTYFPDTRETQENLTDAQGNFEIKKVVPGSYRLKALCYEVTIRSLAPW
jgi:hypothetical protein